MLHHIKVNYQPTTDSNYHTSIAHNHTDAIKEFNRLNAIWPHGLITITSYNGDQPKFITSNDEDLNKRFQQKRLTGNETVIDTPAHEAITADLAQEWLVAA